MLKERLCSLLFPECLQRYKDLPPQPRCPALLSVWWSSVEEQKCWKPAGFWLVQCQPFLSLGVAWKHQPIMSPRATPEKPSSSFTCILLNQGWLILNCRNRNTTSLDGHPAADCCCSEESQPGTFYASVIQFEHCSNFMIEIEHPFALKAAIAPKAHDSHASSSAGFTTISQHPRASPAPS